MLLLCFARICAASNPLLLWVLNRDLRLDIVGRDGSVITGKSFHLQYCNWGDKQLYILPGLYHLKSMHPHLPIVREPSYSRRLRCRSQRYLHFYLREIFLHQNSQMSYLVAASRVGMYLQFSLIIIVDNHFLNGSSEVIKVFRQDVIVENA